MIKKVTFQKYSYSAVKKVTLLRLAIMQTTVNIPLSDRMTWGNIYILLAKLFKVTSCLWGETGLMCISLENTFITNKKQDFNNTKQTLKVFCLFFFKKIFYV